MKSACQALNYIFDSGTKIILFHFLAREETVTSSPLPLTTEASQTTTEPITNTTNTAQQGIRKLLSSLRNLLNVSNKVIVKLVYKIFPWNRRARRRVLGDGEEEEL